MNAFGANISNTTTITTYSNSVRNHERNSGAAANSIDAPKNITSVMDETFKRDFCSSEECANSGIKSTDCAAKVIC